MAKKADNYFVKVSKYQKAHPRATREHAMEMVSKECKSVSGKPKSKTKKSAPRKKSIIKTERITTIGAKRKISVSAVSRAVNISKKIDDLELVLKNTQGSAAKNHIKRLINAEHDKLDAVTRHLKTA